ncbi:MAG: hypothetical protein EA427_03340 [Spirochaetaceae bacterium]|nr:MAG: hypothetical protein EA427_03340 [Spirochaetaceae bacterium]
MRASTTLFLLIFLAGLLFLAACETEPEPMVVWSNVPDTAFLVELYNAERDQPVHFRYISNLTEALTQQRVDADVVIGRWVNNPPARAVMIRDGDNDPWTPLAFNLGTIVFDASRVRLAPDLSVTPEELGENLRLLRDNPDDDPPPMRFVPSLSARFLYEMVRIGGVVPEPFPEGGPRWSAENYDRAFEGVREWQERWNGSAREEREYRERFLYEPWYRLLENQRVLAVYLPSNQFLDWSFFAGSSLDFRWLRDGEGLVRVLEDVVYAGIPEASASRNRARQFISWIRETETQVSLMEHKIEQRIDTFGVFGGFSTEPEVNRRMGREIYGELAGRIPEPDMLALPGPRPRYWDEALEAVVHPYLAAAAGGSDSDGEQLGRQLRRWYDQRGD